MKALIQRVTQANVDVGGQSVGRIDAGILLFLGVEHKDTRDTVLRLCQRILNYRIFADDDGRMNLSLLDTGGSLLAVPQFTLAADTRKGQRPSFSSAAPPEQGKPLFDAFVEQAGQSLGSARLATGQFGADMAVSLVNDGPVTFVLEA
ncbi:D-aminoacyl-tRNA deacylase [Marinobacter nanhaiticus D15-8W]|uniref:D-aminoacyl-tRNA deacylase n=1 Tax=Marinobacter nanhaiticus D15-8W TaxID=626887 RepID=N6WNC0_9GAMM|nr:D-aminoacyl-tRNA deacylase [Marinobacter nanhaiticus]ENO12552.1 D-tyrosyl-tRNA(Tyr) deacylase [Marinobacter nanhaiticus D15-8W]BES69889.1 D-aminoacyl-tRNA deacylase [Marinobacter nanhaiticus D15-8W]